MKKNLISNFLSDVDRRIYARGVKYHRDGKVEKLRKRENHYTAQVMGSDWEPYTVDILMGDGDVVRDWNCTCPYDGGDVCKHVVAALLAIDESDDETTQGPKKPKKRKLQAGDGPAVPLEVLVKQAKKETLAELVLDYSQRDDGFRAAAIFALGTPGEQTLAVLKERVKEAIRRNTRHSCIDMWGCDNICAALDEGLDQAQRLADRKAYPQAMDVARYIVLTGMKLAGEADSSSGALGSTLSSAMELLDECARALRASDGFSEKVKERQLDSFLRDAQEKEYDGWDSNRYELLRRAAQLATAKTAGKLYALLDKLEEAQWEDFRDNEYLRADDKHTRYCVHLAAEGKEAARAYLNENLDVDELRLLAVREDMEGGNYAGAEALCVEKAETEVKSCRRPSQWNYLLFELYQQWGQEEKVVNQAHRLLLLGDTSYYDVLKKLLVQAGRWKKRYPELLKEIGAAWDYSAYMNVLEEEGETALLLEQVRQHPETAFTYGKQLGPDNAQEVYRLCARCIRQEAADAGDRRAYQWVCKELETVGKLGGITAAEALAEELTAAFPRRTAMQDELEKVRRKLRAKAKK